MKRLCAGLCCLVLAMALAAPALADDFHRRPDVPSSRNQAKTTTKQKKAATTLATTPRDKKIVKSVKSENSGVRAKASLQ